MGGLNGDLTGLGRGSAAPEDGTHVAYACETHGCEKDAMNAILCYSETEGLVEEGGSFCERLRGGLFGGDEF